MAVEIEIDLITRQAQANADAMTGSFGKMFLAFKAVEIASELVTQAFSALADAMASSVKDAIAFEAKLAEISTLFSTGFDVDKTRKDLLDLSSAFGLDQADVAKGYYDTISAGITDAADAAKVLEGAAKLATGGLTSQATAIDGLTNIIKGYALDVSKTAEITDTLFIGAQIGKTTIDELSRSIGQVSPLANAAGISMQETVAAMSALTLSGKTTSEATTGLRAAIENLIRPNEAMAKSLEKAGITSVTASLQTDGLTGVFQKLVKVSGGTTEGLAKIFGSVEGLQAVLSLAGPQAGDYSNALKQMGEAAQNAGAVTDTAVNKMRATADFQLKALEASFRNLGTEVFSTLEPGIAKAAEILTGYVNDIKDWVRENEQLFKNIGKKFMEFIDGFKNFAIAVAESETFKTVIEELGKAATQIFDLIVMAVTDIATAFQEVFQTSGGEILGFRQIFQEFVRYITSGIKLSIEVIRLVTVGLLELVSLFQSVVQVGKYVFETLKNVIVDNLVIALNAIRDFINKVSIAFKTIDAVTGKKMFEGITSGLDSANAEIKQFTDSIDRVKIAANDLANTQKKNTVDNIAVMRKAQDERNRMKLEELDGEKESAASKEYYAKQQKIRMAEELEAKNKAFREEQKRDEERKKSREQAAKDHKKYLEEQQKAEYDAFKAEQDAEAFNNEQLLKLDQELTDDLNKAALERATRQIEILKEQADQEKQINEDRKKSLDIELKGVQSKFTLFGGTEDFTTKVTDAISTYRSAMKTLNELSSNSEFARMFPQAAKDVEEFAKSSADAVKKYVSEILGFAKQVASSIISVGQEWSKISEAQFAEQAKAAEEAAAAETEAFNAGLDQRKEDLKAAYDDEIRLFEDKTEEQLNIELERIETAKDAELAAISDAANARIDALKDEADKAKSERAKLLEDQLYPIEVKKDEELTRLKEVQREELKNSKDMTLEQITAIKIKQRAELRAIDEKYAPEIEALKAKASEEDKAANKALEAKKKLILDEEKAQKDAIDRKYKHEEDAAKKANEKIIAAYKKGLEEKLDGELSVLDKLKKKTDKNAKDEQKNADIATQKLNAVSKTADAIGGIFEKIPGPVGLIGSAIAGLVSLVNQLPQIISNLPSIIQGVTDSIPVLIDELGKALGEFIPWLIKDIAQRSFDLNYWLKILENLGGAVLNIFKGVFDGLGDLVDFKSWGGKIWEGLKGAGDAAGEWIKSIGGKIWEGLKSLGESIWAFFSNVGTKIWEGLSSLAETIWGWFKDIGARIWGGLLTAIGDAIETFGEWGYNIWQGFVTAVKDIAAWFAEKGTMIWNGLKDAVSSAGETLKSWGAKIWDGLREALDKVGQFFKDLGGKIWEGLKSGLDSVGNVFTGGQSGGGGAVQTGVTILTGGLNRVFGFSEGGIIGGHASVAGNSTRNDTVPAMLSPGELVVPRTAVDSGLAGILAFARDAIGASSSPTGIARMAAGGMIAGAGTSTSSPFDGIVAELQSLRADVNSIGYSLAKSAVLSHDILSRWDGDGIPQERNF